MALPLSGQISMNDIVSISSRGAEAEASIGWLAYQRTGSLTPPSIESLSDFYGAGGDHVIDFNATITSIGVQNSQNYYRYRALTITGRSAPQTARYKMSVAISNATTCEIRYRLNAAPTDVTYSTLTSGNQSTTTYTIPVTMDYNDTLYIAIYSNHTPTNYATVTLTLLSEGVIQNGLIDSFTASGTTIWSGSTF